MIIAEQNTNIDSIKEEIASETERFLLMTKKLSDMKTFFDDYKLKIGVEPGFVNQEFKNGPNDFVKFQKAVEEMNHIMFDNKFSIFREENNSKIAIRKPVLLTFSDNGFDINSKLYFNYSSVEGSIILTTLYNGKYPDLINEQISNAGLIKLIDNRGQKNGRYANSSNLDVIPADVEDSNIVEMKGDGTMRIKLPSGNNHIINIVPQTTFEEIRTHILSIFKWKDFYFRDSVSPDAINETLSVSKLGMYPRGAVFMIEEKSQK